MNGDALGALPKALITAAPHLTPAEILQWIGALEPAMRAAKIVTPKTVAAFVGQCAYECGFRDLTENLNYSANRLRQVWPGHFGSPEDHDGAATAAPSTHLNADDYANQPERLANVIYANRLGNGPPASGDGWQYRGRGLIQLTGKGTYTLCATALRRKPDDLAGPYGESREGAAVTACWFWTRTALNAYAEAWDIQTMTSRINGDIFTYEARLEVCNRVLAAVEAALA